MPDDSLTRTFGVALGVSLACSFLVSISVVSLKPIQLENEEIAKTRTVFTDLDVIGDAASIADIREIVDSVLIDLATGEIVPKEAYTDTLNVIGFDIKTMAEHPEYGKEIPADLDLAQIRRMPRYMVVHLVKKQGRITKYLLPVYGSGLYSRLYGYLALGKDLKTIEGITFYKHAETPGLGGEIDNPAWKSLWKGKQAFDESGNVRIEVVHGRVDRSKPDARYKIDGISGATYTARGVNQLVRFWLSEEGFGPFIRKQMKKLEGKTS